MTGHPPVTPASSGPRLLTEQQDIFQLDKPTRPFIRSETDPHLVRISMVAAPCYTTWKFGLLLSFFMVPWILFSLLKQRSCSFSAWPSLLSFPIAVIFPSQQAVQLSVLAILSANCPQALPLLWSHYLLCWLDHVHLLALHSRDRWQHLAHDSTIYRGVSADLYLSYFRRLLPPGGHQQQKQAPSEQTFTCSSTSGWGPPTWEILHCL